jgi:hypothetical protein
MKYNAGGNTPRSIDPTLTRKRGALSHPGSLLIAAVALLFFAYIFGYAPWLDTYYNGMVSSINGQRSTAMTIYQMAQPIGLAIGVLVMVAYLWVKLSEGMKNRSKRKMVAGRPGVSEAEFITLAAGYAVSAKVAQQTYKLLHHDYTKSMKVNVKDDLRRDLHWKDNHVLDVMGNLSRQCDRKKNLKANPDAVRTVLDLLLYVESCPKQFLTESSVQRRKYKDAGHHSGMRRAIDGVTRMLKPHHKRTEVLQAAQAPVAAAPVAATPAAAASPAAMPVTPAAAKPVEPMPEKKPALSFIRPRKYPEPTSSKPPQQ